jgi:hypothetical protein
MLLHGDLEKFEQMVPGDARSEFEIHIECLYCYLFGTFASVLCSTRSTRLFPFSSSPFCLLYSDANLTLPSTTVRSSICSMISGCGEPTSASHGELLSVPWSLVLFMCAPISCHRHS